MMAKEKVNKDYSYLRKDLTKVFIVTGVLIMVIILLYFLDLKTDYISQLAERIMNVLIKK